MDLIYQNAGLSVNLRMTLLMEEDFSEPNSRQTVRLQGDVEQGCIWMTQDAIHALVYSYTTCI